MDLDHARREIDKLDYKLLITLAKRFGLVDDIITYKKAHNLTVEDKEREKAMFKRRARQFADLGYDDKKFIERLFTIIVTKSKELQK